MSAGAINIGLPDTLALATEIRREHEAATQARLARARLEHARHEGEIFAEAKAALAHGAWLPWLTRRADRPSRHGRHSSTFGIASEWPRLAAEANTQHGAHLTVRDAVALLAEPRASPHRPRRQ